MTFMTARGRNSGRSSHEYCKATIGPIFSWNRIWDFCSRRTFLFFIRCFCKSWNVCKNKVFNEHINIFWKEIYLQIHFFLASTWILQYFYRISLNSTRRNWFFWHLQVGKLLEAFKILCTDFDHILGKRGETIQGGIFFKGGY